MNKPLLVVMPLFLMVAGCNAQGDNAASTAPAETAATAETVVKSATKADTEPVKAPESKTDAADKKVKPDAKFKVVNEADPRYPADLVAALDKVKVSPPPADMVVPKKARLRIQTSQGPITVELNDKEAPLHVKSFLYLSKIGFYDNTVWHRYEPGFVIQGGDPLTKSPNLKQYYGIGGPGYQVPRETNSLKHNQFVLAMARSSDPNSAGSQFYFTLEPSHNLDEGYTVFGKVIEGSGNVSKLRAGDKLEKVEILSADDNKKTN